MSESRLRSQRNPILHDVQITKTSSLLAPPQFGIQRTLEELDTSPKIGRRFMGADSRLKHLIAERKRNNRDILLIHKLLRPFHTNSASLRRLLLTASPNLVTATLSVLMSRPPQRSN